MVVPIFWWSKPSLIRWMPRRHYMQSVNTWTLPELMYLCLCQEHWWINPDVHYRAKPEKHFTHRSDIPSQCVSDWIVRWVHNIWYHLWNDWRRASNVFYTYIPTPDYRMRWVDTMTHRRIWRSIMKCSVRVRGWIWSVDVADPHRNTLLRSVKWRPNTNHASYPILVVLKCGCLD